MRFLWFGVMKGDGGGHEPASFRSLAEIQFRLSHNPRPCALRIHTTVHLVWAITLPFLDGF
jgi:hypothetical protein